MRERQRVRPSLARSCACSWAARSSAASLLLAANAAVAEQDEAAIDLPAGDSAKAASYATTAPARAFQPPRIERLGIAGGMLLGQTYTWSVLLATGVLLVCKWDETASSCLLPSRQAAWYDLYIPLAGPFVAMRHEEVRTNWKYMVPFSALGVGQNVGFALAATYFFWPKQPGDRDARVVPWVDASGVGVNVVGAF